MAIITPPRSICAVSVVIPMYNVEKYIGECLESILYQTFQDFEVIAVNDCSTDNGVKIVERYIPKFGGRLKLFGMEKNSGSGALPRNKGLKLSRGEYIFFVDADDLITPTALEELYINAENFSADVVYTERYYESNHDLSNVYIKNSQSNNFVDKPTFETDDLAKRVNGILNTKYLVTPWTKFVKRDFLIEHEIFFPHVAISEDNIWTFALIFYAKKLLRVPNVVYVYRLNKNSVGQKKKTPEETINFWGSPLISGVKNLNNLMSKLEFFQNNPKYRYAVLANFLGKCSMGFSYSNLPQFAIYETIKQNFGKNLGEQDVLVSVLCALLNAYQMTLFTTQNELNEFKAQMQQITGKLE